MNEKDQRVATVKSEIINRVLAIESKKADKKAHSSALNKIIHSLEAEKQTLLHELRDLQSEELSEDADELLEEAGSKELTIKNMN